jgi:beta-aspartyl-peptidase (threonine type)
MDAKGALAAATSTGGTPGQLPGRIGDSPIVGAGTWADERCAISCTGDGEALMTAAAAHSVAALVDAGLPLAEAADRVVAGLAGADAGLIAVDSAGTVALPFNTTLMNRAWRSGDGPTTTAVWSTDARVG